MTALPHRSEAAPLRRFGQNFLVDPQLAASIVDHFDPTAADRIVEVGPGRGALTRRLAERAGRFVAIELDRRQIAPLEQLLADLPQASVRHADALAVDYDALAAELGGPLRLIGNLPYNVGTAIVRRWLGSAQVQDIQAVLQKEVVDRLLAAPRSKAYGALTVITALMMERRRVMMLAPGAFHPRPKVTSSLVQLRRRPEARLTPERLERFERWLFRGFAERRKMLSSNFAPHRDAVRAALGAQGLAPDLRAEALTPEQWLAFVEELRLREVSLCSAGTVHD